MDFFSWLGLSGYTVKDGWRYIRSKFKKECPEYTDFKNEIRNIITVVCDKYRDFISISPDHNNIVFPTEYDNIIFDSIIDALENGSPYTIDKLLINEDISNSERSRLFKLLQVSLKESFEFYIREHINKSFVCMEKMQAKIDCILDKTELALNCEKKVIDTIKHTINSWNIEPITIEFINRNVSEENKAKKYVQAYYNVNDRDDILAHTICGNYDVVDPKLHNILSILLSEATEHLFVVGRGGEGKTSTIFRLSLEYARIGGPSYWLKLHDFSITNHDKESLSNFLDEVNEYANANFLPAIIFIDNLFQGKKTVDLLQSIWKESYNIRLVCAERIENMNQLCSPTQNLLTPWITYSKFICLLSEEEIEKTFLKNYTTIAYPIPNKHKIKILKNLANVWSNIQKNNFNTVLYQIENKIKNENIPIAELILHLKIQYNLSIKEKKSINVNFVMPWDMWSNIVDNKFNLTNSFKWIATFSRIGVDLPVRDFVNYYGINYNVFVDLIKHTYDTNIYTPYQIIYKNTEMYLKATHDIISDLFFDVSEYIKSDSFDENINLLNSFLSTEKCLCDITLAAAGYYFDKSCYEKSILLYRKLLDEHTLSEMSQATISKLLSDVYRDIGNYDDAIKFGHKATEKYVQLNGLINELTSQAFNSLGLAYQYKNMFTDALNYYKQAMVYFETTGNKNISYAYLNNSIGLTYRSMSSAEKSVFYFKKAEQIIIKELGKSHPDIAMVYNNIAGSYLLWHHYDLSKKYYRKALQIRKLTLGEEHIYTATTYLDFGYYYYNVKCYKQAITYYNKALKIYKQVLPDNHYDIGETHFKKGLVYAKQGKYNKAIEYYNIAKSILIQFVSNDSNIYTELEKELKLALEYMGNTK